VRVASRQLPRRGAWQNCHVLPRTRRTLRWALLTAATAAPGHALDPALAITQYVRTGWRAPVAIPHDNVTAIVQGRDGYLWVGTVDGLARFDGVRSRLFDKSNTPAIRDNWIRGLAEDGSGRLWIATLGGGLVCRLRGDFVHIGPERGLDTEAIHVLFVDRDDRLWVGSNGRGVYRFDGERFVRPPGTEALAGWSVRGVAQDPGGTIWLGTDHGLFALADGEVVQAPEAIAADREPIDVMASDREGIWVGTERRGLTRLVEGRVAARIERARLAFPRVWALAVDRDENLWIGTDGGGLQRYSGGRLATFRQSDGLASNYVWALAEDREHGLWVGTNGGGLLRLKAGAVTTLTTREGLTSDFVWSVLRTADGALWVGAEEGGAVRLVDGAAFPVGAAQGLRGSVRAIVEGAAGEVWLGGDGGLHVWKNGRARPVAVPGHPAAIVHSLARDREGTIWIGWVSGGVSAWRAGEFSQLPVEEGLAGASTNTLLVTADGTLWIGTASGLSRRDSSGELTRWTRAQGLPGDYVTALFEGPAGILWIATRSGLARLEGGRIDAVTAADGLFDDALMAALAGDDGNIWMGSNRGLFSASRSAIEASPGARERGLASRALGLEDGLRSLEINQTGSSSFKDRGGRLWFATRAGLATLDPARLRPNPMPPRVAIEEVLADGRLLAPGGGWKLPAGTQRIELRFTALSFESIHGLRIEYRLEGFDSAWVAARSDRYASYTNLPHGRYRFHVVATNSDGLRNDLGDAVDFVIAPRLTEALWFRVAALLFVLLAAPAFYLARVRLLHARTLALERLVAERTAEVETANTRLAQMAREDALTGVANRRAFDEVLAEEWRRAERQATPLALMMIDVDLFKAYNDRLGHPEGDACLRTIAQEISRHTRRAGEMVARYGGEEFAVLLPGCAREEALAAAEKLRSAIRTLGLPHPQSEVAPVVTVSIGVAAVRPSAATSSDALLDASDRALYRAKHGGRDRVAWGEILPG
jgi:diguanylate cyclase (GGDEF)-like protein